MITSESGGTLSYSLLRIKNQQKQFWWLQIIGWLGYAVIVYVAVVAPVLTPEKEIRQFLHLANETLVGFVLSFILWQLIRWVVYSGIKFTIFICCVIAAILAAIWNLIKLTTYKALVLNLDWLFWDWNEYAGWYMFSLAVMLVWTGFSFVMIYNSQLQAEHEKVLKAETQARESQLLMLRYQLNPHFMFNTLNSISTLILRKKNDKANTMLDQLSQFYRYSLEISPMDNTKLSQEIDSLELYLEIQKIRFNERLKVNIDIDASVRTAIVPSFLLQPLVENSIKYAIEGRKEGGTILIEADKKGERLVISVTDDGPGIETDRLINQDSSGIGLVNTRERLETLYANDFDFKLHNKKEGGLQVEVSIPLKVRDADA